jgi:hypothetical protein
VVVQRPAVRAEEQPELGIRFRVAALTKGRQAGGVPGSGRERPVAGRVNGRVRPGQQRSRRVMLAAQDQNCRGGQVRRRGDRLHLVRRRRVAGLAGRRQGLVPAAAVDAGPLQSGYHGAAGAAHPRGAQPADRLAQEADRQFGLVEEPGGPADQRMAGHRPGGDLIQQRPDPRVLS